MSDKGSLLIIANPCSGKGKALKIAPKVKRILMDAGYDVDLVFTRCSGDAIELASIKPHKTIVAIGGDGTLNEVISGIMKSARVDVAVGYIPLGSTNDFARSVGIPRKWRKAAQCIAIGVERAVDICKFGDRYFSYVAAHGIFAETSCSVSQKLKNKIGHLAYILFGVKEVFRKNNYPIKIEIDGRLIEDSYAFLGIGNTKSIGGILKFDDDSANISDGLFEVLMFKYPKNLWQLSRMLKKVSRSDWQGDGLEMYHARKAKIYPKQEMLWSLDGEKLILDKESEIEIIPNAIKIKVK